ncbi:nematocin receptor 2-like [Saccostrea echinata]|uniref:nematocin receptor 2-like n=1 Tax=Saccostrea echinata TaxID=191078 RepID=UPI002A7F6ECC|nr:nematocin receptor 2-like [Saccostrea echinata]
MENKTFDLDDWNEEYIKRYTASTVILSIYLLFGVVGNLTVLIIYSTKMHSKQDDRYFIPFLAGVDFVGCVVSTSEILIENNEPYKYPGNFTCKSLHMSACASIVSSTFMLLVIAIQRYQKICRTFGFQMNLSFKRIAASLIISLACGFALPITFLYGIVEVYHPTKNITGFRCGPVPNTDTFREIYQGIIITAEASSVICMSVLYALVGYTLVKKMKYPKKSTHSVALKSIPSSKVEKSTEETETFDTITETKTIENMESKKKSKCPPKTKRSKGLTGKQYSLMFMVISLVSILCFFPPWIFMILETQDKTFWNHLSFQEAQVFNIIRGMFILNFVVNPFIYGFFDSKFRGKILECLVSLKRFIVTS